MSSDATFVQLPLARMVEGDLAAGDDDADIRMPGGNASNGGQEDVEALDALPAAQAADQDFAAGRAQLRAQRGVAALGAEATRIDGAEDHTAARIG